MTPKVSFYDVLRLISTKVSMLGCWGWGGGGRECGMLVMVYFFVWSKFSKISLTPNFYLKSWDTKFWMSVKPGFHVLHILWIEALTFVATEEIRPFLFKAYKLFSFNFVLLLNEKDVSHITINLTNPESTSG